MKILYLPVKKEWFEMERSGVKPEEYRNITPYWVKRIMKNCPISWQIAMDISIETKDFSFFFGKTFDGFTHVELSSGYPMKGDVSRRILFEIKEIVLGKGKPEWGAPAEDVFIVRLGNKTVQL